MPSDNAGRLWPLALFPFLPILASPSFEAQSLAPASQLGKVVQETKIGTDTPGLRDTLDDLDNFGWSASALGDIDGDGVADLAVGSPLDDDAGPGLYRGAVWILHLTPQGTVRSKSKISSTRGGFIADLDAQAAFGRSVAALGDLDGDGIADLAVGAEKSVGSPGNGGLWILFLTAEGSVKRQLEITEGLNGFRGSLSPGDDFGRAVTPLGDLDGDGVLDLAVGAPSDDGGGAKRGAMWILFLNADGTVKKQSKISPTAGGPLGAVTNLDLFGTSLAAAGDLDGDGVLELAVGMPGYASNRGGVWIVSLNPDGTIGDARMIASGSGGFTGPLEADSFGTAVTSLPDLDGDGVSDLAVGAPRDGFTNQGAVWILFLNPDGTVKAQSKIDDSSGGFGGTLKTGYRLGQSLAFLGDLGGDGVPELAAGTPGDDEGGVLGTSSPGAANRGATWVLSLSRQGTAIAEQKISDGSGTFEGTLDDEDFFGSAICASGDLDGDLVSDYLVAASGNGASGGVWVFFANHDGSIRDRHLIEPGRSGFAADLEPLAGFGSSVTAVGDVDGDGVVDLAVGAPAPPPPFPGRTGAVWILLMENRGIVRDALEIGPDGAGGFLGLLQRNDRFGWSVAPLGDLDGDGVPDLAVGALGGGVGGAVWILFLNQDGSVKREWEITDGLGGLQGPLRTGWFGSALASLGDMDGDGALELAVGQAIADAVWILSLDSGGVVVRERRIELGIGGLPAVPSISLFGSALTVPGDLDGDGVLDLIVGAPSDDDGPGFDRGAAWILFLRVDGSVKGYRKINEIHGGFGGTLDASDGFGSALAALGEGDGDGRSEILVGAPGDDDGGEDHGAVWILSLEEDERVPPAENTTLWRSAR